MSSVETPAAISYTYASYPSIGPSHSSSLRRCMPSSTWSEGNPRGAQVAVGCRFAASGEEPDLRNGSFLRLVLVAQPVRIRSEGARASSTGLGAGVGEDATHGLTGHVSVCGDVVGRRSCRVGLHHFVWGAESVGRCPRWSAGRPRSE